MASLEEAAETLARFIRDASRVTVFTGAGISTESGIPDFRSPGGVWTKMKPIMFDEFCSSRDVRREAWRRVYERTAGWTGATPNAGHVAVAKLVEWGKAASVITQNVDNLHQDSGVPTDKVIELHGNASFAKCLKCASHYTYDELQPRYEAGHDIACETCGGLIKSAVISFGQPMPEREMERATEEAMRCDLMLVLGSSLVVYPAAGLPLLAKRAGATLAIVNRDPTELDDYADLVLNTEIGPLMAATVARLA